MNVVVTVLLSFLSVALAIAAMAVGVMAGRTPIKGSCGGVSGRGCELCSGSCRRRTES